MNNINNMDSTRKINYAKCLIIEQNLTNALSILLKDEKKDLEIIDVILKVISDDTILNKIKEETYAKDITNVKLYVYSRILSVLSFYKKNGIISKFLNRFNDAGLKQIAIYEYQNKTDVSYCNKTFNKYCSKYKKEALSMLQNKDEEILMLTMEMEKYNLMTNIEVKRKKKKIFPYVIIFSLIIMFVFAGYWYYDSSKLISKYDGLFLPGIYINEINLSGKKVSDLDNILETEKNNIANGSVIVTNANGEYKFTYQDLNINIDLSKVKKEIEKYNNDLTMIDKVKLIKSNKKNKIFYLNASFDDESINSFMSLLKEKMNVSARNDSIVVDENNNVYYDKGVSGFSLEEEKTKEKVKTALANLKEETIIEAEGSVIKQEIKNAHLSSINKKISTYTTYFANKGNRGHNITLASSKLNNTIIMPGETFSYLKVVGPYNSSNGYLPAPIYLNGVSSTSNGGGVCQLASTIYMAQLKAGLQTVIRRNHSIAPTYIPKGLDATVYSTTTDYKFKNQYEYPIYIVSYVRGDYLTVDIWSNENALGGKTFEPYSIYSNGGYLTYLKVIENGKVVEQKYLDKSYYKNK